MSGILLFAPLQITVAGTECTDVRVYDSQVTFDLTAPADFVPGKACDLVVTRGATTLRSSRYLAQ